MGSKEALVRHVQRSRLFTQGDVEEFVNALDDAECRALLKSVLYVKPQKIVSFLEDYLDVYLQIVEDEQNALRSNRDSKCDCRGCGCEGSEDEGF